MPKQGYGLLIAATPAGAHPALAAAEALPALAAVPPAVLLGTAHGSVVQLAEPADPHAVLAQLRTAAAHRGPLVVYIAGQLVPDGKQRLPHLALAKSTPRSVRYTGLPWHWITAELAGRPPQSTTLVVDLVAGEPVLQQRLSGAGRGDGGADVYGCLVPLPAKRQTHAPTYSRALAAQLRGCQVRPPWWQLHQQAVRDAGLPSSAVLFGDGAGGGHPTEYAGGPGAGSAGVAGPAGVPAHTAQSPRPEEAYPEPWAVPNQPVYQGTSGDPQPAAAPAPDVPQDGGAQQAAPVAGAAPSGAPTADAHRVIAEAAGAGRYGEAMAVANAWETAALRAGGPGSQDAVHWAEVRADLAHQSGDPAWACELWLHAAATRLQTGQDPEAASVFSAVDRAHHCWHRLTDLQQTVRLGQRLAELREWAPGRQAGALEDVRNRLHQAEQELSGGGQDSDGAGTSAG